jgi:lysyl-tRNA synthetase class I
MTKKQIFIRVMPLITFAAGGIFAILLLSLLDTSAGREQERAYEVLNYVLQKKLKDDISYAVRCCETGKITSRKVADRSRPLRKF